MRTSAAAALAALLAHPGAGHSQARTVTWVAGGPEPGSRPPAGYVNLALVLGSGPAALRQGVVNGVPHAGPGRTRDVAISEMEGLTAQQAAAPDAQVHFRLHRDAGTFDCRGALRSGRGNGTCDFVADEGFAAELARRGVGRPTDAQQLELGVHEARLSLLDALAAAHVATPTVSDLLRAAEAGVDAAYVRDVAAAGFRARSLGELVDLHGHGVDAALVRELHALGYSDVSAGELVRLRDLRVTPDFVRRVNARAGARQPIDRILWEAQRGM